MTIRAYLLPFLLFSIALFAACSGPPERGDSYVITMKDNFFEPAELRIPVGASVTFVNAGEAPHNAVASNGSWSTESAFGSLIMLAGDETTLTFDEPGVSPYYCTFHGTAQGAGMYATLIVGDETVVEEVEPVAAPERAGESVTRHVPADYPTIQSAVDAAAPGDLVLIEPGVYREQVNVSTPNLVIRGTDRNAVIIDSEFQRDHGIFIAGADGVAVENLTVQSARINGLFWTNVTGYRASYVTAIDASVYGIYAFDSTDGLFEYSYASGSRDSGFYIGQCDPCNAVIDHVISEYNALGYSGTNASRQIFLLNSIWRNNGVGIVPNTLDSELLPPVKEVTIMGNAVYNNGRMDVPMRAGEWPINGNGIALMGNKRSLVERNRITNHWNNGIYVAPMLDDNFYSSDENIIRNNVVEGSGRADLALGGPAGPGNCFQGNDAATSMPPGLSTLLSCNGPRLPLRLELTAFTDMAGRAVQGAQGWNPQIPIGSVPKPPPQPQMPGGAAAPVRPAVNVFADYPLDMDAITVPDLPDGVTVTQTKTPTLFGLLVGGYWINTLFGLYGGLALMSLFALWLALALWDLSTDTARRSRGSVLGWTGAILFVPLLGLIAYYVAGKSRLPVWARLFLLIVPLLVYIAVVLGTLLGSGAI